MRILKFAAVIAVGVVALGVAAYAYCLYEFMQGYRVLCVTTHKNSEKMWSDYGEDHKGAVLRIEPNVAKDSKLQLFRPLVYREKRPPLYDDTLEFISPAL
jgi:hypothetical protein